MNARTTRQKLSDYHSFLVLALGISRHQSPNPSDHRLALDSLSDFLQTAPDLEILQQSADLQRRLGQAVQAHDNMLPRLKPLADIAHDFRQLLKEEPDIWRFGVQHRWLADRFDLSKLPQAIDLPGHARIGLGIHAGRVIVEEITLLEDAFFLLVRARKSCESLLSLAESVGFATNIDDLPEDGARLGALNSCVCTFSRLCVLTAAAFVEAFVNSVGWHEAERLGRTEQDRAMLQGVSKGRYLSLEAKLQGFPKIIRSDKASPIVLSDEGQRREPFVSFLKETKAVRDASMHYAPGKAPILHPPQEWLEMAESSTRHAVAVAREFWSACYPDREQPMYLASLFYDGLVRQALDRLAAAAPAEPSGA